MKNTTFLQAVEQSWSEIGDSYQSSVCRLDDRSKVVLEVIAPEHLALVEGWEHASCLDISVMDIQARTLSIISAGPCATRDEIGVRLGQLVGFLAGGKNDA